MSHKFCDLICYDLLLRQNCVVETKIFTKIIQYAKRFVAAMCLRDILLQLVA